MHATATTRRSGVGTALGSIRAEHTCAYTATGDINVTDIKLLYISIFTEEVAKW